ncbi:hypothetical protein HDV02_003735 [Globomyces sp. JEL0801]|nr:hypothetical protein HDV02_003735 [Globomyces sp. JEL0801]
MGNPVFVDEIPSNHLDKQKTRGLAHIMSQPIRNRYEELPLLQSLYTNSAITQNAPNDHPIRNLLVEPVTSEIIDEEIDPVDELEQLIIRQLQPRSFSLLFGGNGSQNMYDTGLMETAMGRLRGQLRNSTTRLAQETSLTHRTTRLDTQDSRDRLDIERVRRVRHERRNENSISSSSFYRWNSSNQHRNSNSFSIRRFGNSSHLVQNPSLASNPSQFENQTISQESRNMQYRESGNEQH